MSHSGDNNSIRLKNIWLVLLPFLHIVVMRWCLVAKKASPIKVGQEKFGELKLEEAFVRALEMFFIKQQEKKTPG